MVFFAMNRSSIVQSETCFTGDNLDIFNNLCLTVKCLGGLFQVGYTIN